MHVWFGFIFRCEALQEYWRHPEVLQNDLQYFTTFKTTKLMNQVSSSDSHSLIFSSEISELKAKTSEWPRFTNIRRNYTNVLSTENCPYRPNFCAILRYSKIIRVVWSKIEPQYRSELVCYTMLYHYCGWSINTCIVIDMPSLAVVLGSLIFTEIHKHSSTAVHKNPKNNVLSTEKWPNIPPLLRK